MGAPPIGISKVLQKPHLTGIPPQPHPSCPLARLPTSGRPTSEPAAPSSCLRRPQASLAHWASLGVDLESPQPPCEPPGNPSAAAAAAAPPPAQSAASGPGCGGGGRGGGGGGSEDALAGLRELTEAARNSPQEGEEEEDGDDESEEVQQMGTLVQGMVATLEEEGEGEGQEMGGGTSASTAGKAGAAQVRRRAFGLEGCWGACRCKAYAQHGNAPAGLRACRHFRSGCFCLPVG